MLGNNFVLCEGHVIHAEEEIDIAAFGYQQLNLRGQIGGFFIFNAH